MLILRKTIPDSKKIFHHTGPETMILQKKKVYRKPVIQPANHSIFHNNWKILAFCDVDQIPLAEIWYNQLTKLGYDEHEIAALDNNVLKVGLGNIEVICVVSE